MNLWKFIPNFSFKKRFTVSKAKRRTVYARKTLHKNRVAKWNVGKTSHWSRYHVLLLPRSPHQSGKNILTLTRRSGKEFHNHLVAIGEKWFQKISVLKLNFSVFQETEKQPDGNSISWRPFNADKSLYYVGAVLCKVWTYQKTSKRGPIRLKEKPYV